jgi:hypothetical protein
VEIVFQVSQYANSHIEVWYIFSLSFVLLV